MQKTFCIAKLYFSDVGDLNGGDCEKIRFCEKQNVEKQSTKLHFSVILISKHYKRLHFVQKNLKMSCRKNIVRKMSVFVMTKKYSCLFLA